MSFKLKDAIQIGQPKLPPRITVVGVEGVGKSTFGNRFPKPLFICAENGLVGSEFKKTENVNPSNWTMVLETVKALILEDNKYKTIVIDTLDWLETMLFNFICQRDGKKDIESYGFGKGFTIASDEFKKLLVGLEKLRQDKGFVTVLLTHCHIKTFSNPTGDNYDRYEMKLNKKISALVKEWSDAVLFAQFEVYTHKESSKAKAKAVGTDDRIVYTRTSPMWDAKNRFNLPEKLPLDYDEVMKSIETEGQDADVELYETIETLIDESEAMSDELKDKARKALERDKGDVIKLKTLLNKIKASA